MIGSLRHRVTLQQNFPTRSQGVKTDVWSDIATVYARVEPLRGSEVTSAEQREALNLHRVTMRYRPVLTELFQFLDGDTFDDLSGDPFVFLGYGLDALQYLDGTEVDFLDGYPFNLLARKEGPPGKFRVRFGTRYFDIRDVQQLYPHDEFTVMRVEEVVT